MKKFSRMSQKEYELSDVKSIEKLIGFYPYIMVILIILGLGVGTFALKEEIIKHKLIKSNTRKNKSDLEENKRNLFARQHEESNKCSTLTIELRTLLKENAKLKTKIDEILKEQETIKDSFLSLENEETQLKENFKVVLNQKQNIENEYQLYFATYDNITNQYKDSNSVSNIVKNSVILDTENDLNVLRGFIDNKNLELCYSSKLDGFNSLTFHQKCDDKQKTLALYETSYFERFGGYTEKRWNGQDGKEDPNAFVFNLETKKKFSFNKNTNTTDKNSIYPNDINYPSFGGIENRYDILINDMEKPNQAEGHSKFPTSYKQNDKSDVLCHREAFEIINIEVYSIIE